MNNTNVGIGMYYDSPEENEIQKLTEKNDGLRSELTAALSRVTELEAQFQADGNHLSHLNMHLTRALAENEKLEAQAHEFARENVQLKAGLEMGQMECDQEYANQAAENILLRAIFPRILTALKSGGCTFDCSVEFYQKIPDEVSAVVDAFRQQVADLTRERDESKPALMKKARAALSAGPQPKGDA